MIIGLMLCAAACKKDINGSLSQVTNKNDKNSSNASGQSSLVAKWNIVTDSTFAGAGITNHAVDYSGQPEIILILGQMAIFILKKGPF